MNRRTIMLVAGEASGDLLGAELVEALREELTAIDAKPSNDAQPLYASLEPRFIGAGGPRMAAAGVKTTLDMTAHSVVGLFEVFKHLAKFRRIFKRLYRLACEERPEAIVCIDFSGFNRRLAHAVRQMVRNQHDWFHNWDPKLIQYVSPQVWASRERRAYQVAKDYDLLLSIFPFEKDWYANRVPDLRVEFVGNPILDRHRNSTGDLAGSENTAGEPQILLLPGSRGGELQRHLPVMTAAFARIRKAAPQARGLMVLPRESLLEEARRIGFPEGMQAQIGGLASAMEQSTVAIASTGTVTMECAFFGLPTVALYKTSWSTYQIAKRIVKVKHLAMPNLLAGRTLFPEFVQNDATPDNVASAALEILQSADRRVEIKTGLAEVIRGLGPAGASRRAARAICQLLSQGESRHEGEEQNRLPSIDAEP